MESLSQSARHSLVSASTARDNLHQVHTAPTEWDRARLIACSVEKLSSNGIFIRPLGDVGKVSTEEAAELVGVQRPLLERYLQTWNYAAMSGHCDSSGALRPEDGLTARLPNEDYWNTYWKQAK